MFCGLLMGTTCSAYVTAVNSMCTMAPPMPTPRSTKAGPHWRIKLRKMLDNTYYMENCFTGTPRYAEPGGNNELTCSTLQSPGSRHNSSVSMTAAALQVVNCVLLGRTTCTSLILNRPSSLGVSLLC
jgi:hypothetical protein